VTANGTRNVKWTDFVAATPIATSIISSVIQAHAASVRAFS
jgi:hypothetical protein